MQLTWTDRQIPGHAAIAKCAYLGTHLLAAIDTAMDEGRPVWVVYLATSRGPTAICESLFDAQAIVERLVTVARFAA